MLKAIKLMLNTSKEQRDLLKKFEKDKFLEWQTKFYKIKGIQKAIDLNPKEWELYQQMDNEKFRRTFLNTQAHNSAPNRFSQKY